LENILFINKDRTQFFGTLRKRVDVYFKEKGISRNADWRMYLKTVAMFSFYFVPFALILFGGLNQWIMLGLALFMGVAVSGIGLSIMHDSNHGGYSKNHTVNNVLGYSLNLIGGAAFNWKVQHNLLHHTYTNIYGHDEDLNPEGVMRFSPKAEHRWFFKYQHIYAIFLYGIMTFFWVLHKDFKQLIRYKNLGLIDKAGSTFSKELVIMIVSKILYYAYMLVLPVFVLEAVTFGQWIIGFVIMHFIAGVLLALVFQSAHVVEHVDFPVPDDKNQIENEWAIHQLVTTSNFARKNKLVSWYVGGLNYQVEHHLFPLVCHVHYHDLAAIVKETAEEFDLPYNDEPTFSQAINSHFTFLKKLGREDYQPSTAAA